MPGRRIRATIALAGALALVAGACDGDGDGAGRAERTTTTTTRPDPRTNGALALGQLAPLTGDLAVLAPSFTKPVELAVTEINAAGGVGGAPVTVVVADDGTVPATAEAALTKLVDTDQVDVVIGPSSSNLALALMEQAKTAPVLECAGSNTAAALSEADSGGYYFRTTPSDRLQAVALARLLVQDGRTTPAFLVRDDTYGVELGRATARALRKAGAKPQPIVAYDPGGVGVAEDVAEVATRRPDAVVVIGFPEDGAKVLAAMNGAGIGPATTPVYGADAMESAALGALVDPANPAVVAGMKGTTPAPAPAGIEHPFAAAFATAGVDDVFSSYYYDCTILSALAAVQAGSDDPAKLSAAFAKNLTGKTRCNTFAACKAALEAGESIHYEGASSSFDRWDEHEPGQGRYDIWSYDASGKPTTAPPLAQINVP